MIKKKNLPESLEQKESLISSNTLPEFIDLEQEYAAEIQAIKEEESKVKKPRAKSAASSPALDIPPSEDSLQVRAEEIEDSVCFPFNIFLTRYDKKPLSGIERKAFSRNCASLFNKYAPQFTGKWAVEIGFAICCLTILLARWELPQKKEKEQKEPEKPATPVKQEELKTEDKPVEKPLQKKKAEKLQL